VGWIVEYFGDGATSLSVPQRATITNMGAELGVTTSVFPSDECTRDFLAAQGREQDYAPLGADTDVAYDRVIEISLTDLEPMAACPSSPDNVRTIPEISGMDVQQVVIGSCTNSSLSDMMMVAKVLKGREVHPSVELGIAPGSKQVLNMMAKNGALADVIAAGARLLESGCGPCIGQGFSPGSGAVSLRTFNRNFPGRSGSKGDQVYLVSPETAVAGALTGKLTDPRSLDIAYPVMGLPEAFDVDDRMIQAPATEDEAGGITVLRGPTIVVPEAPVPLVESLTGQVILKCEDKITTDHIMPAGTFLKLRSNVPEYAKVVFNCFSEPGKPTFAERGLALKAAGIGGIIVAGQSYGQGSSREHAALCPMYLGVRVVLAKSIERIHRANLINFCIVPLTFADPADYDRLVQDETLEIKGLREAVQNSDEIVVTQADGGTLVARLTLSQRDREILLADGLLSFTRTKNQ
ncbi:MAG: aconitate hydratase, partial [Phycisphaeraceae bacterium]|nr:aconitate hydratase [Phycisphaeraceae bacterium]